jgi:hypothetical protein
LSAPRIPLGGLNLQLLDARHRAHARVEDQVRTTKGTGLGHLPSKSWQINTGWWHAVTIAIDLLAWFKLLGCTGQLARAVPKNVALPATDRASKTHLRATPQMAMPTPPRAWSEALATATGKIRNLPVPEPQPG